MCLRKNFQVSHTNCQFTKSMLGFMKRSGSYSLLKNDEYANHPYGFDDKIIPMVVLRLIDDIIYVMK